MTKELATYGLEPRVAWKPDWDKSAFRNRATAFDAGFEPDDKIYPFYAEVLQGQEQGNEAETSVRAAKRAKQKFVHPLSIARLGGRVKVWNSPVRSSMLTDKCQRRVMYRYRLRLRPKWYVRAFGIGAIYHTIMMHEFLGKGVQSGLAAAAKRAAAYEEDLKSIVDPETGLLPNGKGLRETLDYVYMDLQKAKTMAIWTAENHPLDQEKFAVLDAEKTIRIKYPTLPQGIVVRLDALIWRRGTDEVYILDHKTVGKKDLNERALRVRVEVQPRLYRLATEAYLKEHNRRNGTSFKAVGFMHRYIRKPGIQFSPDTRDALVTTYSSEIAKKLATGKPLTARQADLKAERDEQIAFDQRFESPWDKYLWRVGEWYKAQETEAPEYPVYLKSNMRFWEPIMTEEFLMQLRLGGRLGRARCDSSRFFRDPSGRECDGCPFWQLCENKMEQWPEIIDANFDVMSREEEEKMFDY